MSEFFQLHRNVRLRVIIIFFSTLTSNMIFPFMAIYFARFIGISATSIILSIAILCNIAAGMLGGYFSDRIGRKKLMILSEGLRVITYLMLLLSNLPGNAFPYITIVFFVMNSICSGLYGPASEAMLLDVTNSAQRKLMYSILYWATNLSIALGGTLGALLFNKHLFFLFMLLLFTSICSFIITYKFIVETNLPQEEQNKKRNVFKDLFLNYRTVMKDSLFIIFILASMLLFSIESHLANFIAIRLESNIQDFVLSPLNWTLDGIQVYGYLRTENTILVIILSIIFTQFIKAWPEKRTMFIGFSMYIFGYVILSYSNQAWILFGIMVIAVLGEVLFVPIYESLLGDLAPDHLRGSYLALNKIATKGASLIGAIGVYLAHVLSPIGITIFVGLSGVIAILLLYMIMPAIYERRKQFNEI
ncbi:MFS transporter [Paenibacillus sp. 276b]|uniref:MFS transporter n=1 Tax=Paenibacillus sp. 276b TaxID=1566277 RepID=UPI0008999637|nr:MFS transporter [Paenibacillus sp. 276b]SEB10059.1 MFS transporter, DHA1 family, multidrug resistance protein B [Paenibacillus sp. 276b]